MSRKLNAKLVVLPALDAGGALALSASVLARAKEDGRLTEAIAASVKRLEESVTTLTQASTSHVQTQSLPNEEEARAAKRSFHAAWSAASNFLMGWAKVSDQKGGERPRLARQVAAGLLDGGTKFLRLPEQKRWAMSEMRLQWLMDQGLENAFGRLGGAVFLVQLREAHQKYGEVLAITRSAAPSPEGPTVRAALDAVRTRLQEFVMQVTAFGATEAEDAKERSAKMLAPIAQWESIRSKPHVREPAQQPAPVVVTAPVTPPHV